MVQDNYNSISLVFSKFLQTLGGIMMVDQQESPKKEPIIKDWKPKTSQALFWVLVVAVMALIPLFLNVSQNLLRGDNINVVITKYFPDFLIVIFSLAISIFYDIVHPCHHKWTLVVTVISMIICVGFYYILDSIETIQPNYLNVVIGGSVILYFANLLLGGALKWRTIKKHEKKDEGQCEYD